MEELSKDLFSPFMNHHKCCGLACNPWHSLLSVHGLCFVHLFLVVCLVKFQSCLIHCLVCVADAGVTEETPVEMPAISGKYCQCVDLLMNIVTFVFIL